MEKTKKQAAAMFYLDAVAMINEGGGPIGDPDYYDLTPDDGERILEAIKDHRMIVLEDIPDIAIPRGLQYSIAFSALDGRRQIVTSGRFATETQDRYSGVDLIRNFAGDARGRLERFAGSMGTRKGGRFTGAIFAIAILFRFLRMRGPRWIDPFVEALGSDGSLWGDDEIALAYAGAFVALEAELATAAMMGELEADVDGRATFEERVMSNLSPAEIQRTREKAGIGFSPADLSLTTPAVWTLFLQRSIAAFDNERES